MEFILGICEVVKFLWCNCFHRRYWELRNRRILEVSIVYEYKCLHCGLEQDKINFVL